jgi:hypothetical protein
MARMDQKPDVRNLALPDQPAGDGQYSPVVEMLVTLLVIGAVITVLIAI